MTGNTSRRAIVVGGSMGIGRGIADAWAGTGADVTVCSRTRPAGPGAERLGWEYVDLTRPEAARETLGALGAAGTLDAVCFSAVVYGARRANFLDLPEQEWRAQVDTNATGLWMTLAATLPALRHGRTRLFLGISSEVALNAGPGRSGYAASKAAAKMLLDSVAQEEPDDGARIVQALPAGMVDTPGIRRRRPPDFDYSSYMVPADFAPLATLLLTEGGAAHHADCLVVDHGGVWWSVADRLPVSQSRRL